MTELKAILTAALTAKLAVKRASKEGKCEALSLKSVFVIHKDGTRSLRTYGPLYEGPLFIDEREKRTNGKT